MYGIGGWVQELHPNSFIPKKSKFNGCTILDASKNLCVTAVLRLHNIHDSGICGMITNYSVACHMHETSGDFGSAEFFNF